MSRCSSPSGAVTLVIACPQPRGSKFHRIVNLQKAVYGWSQVEDVGEDEEEEMKKKGKKEKKRKKKEKKKKNEKKEKKKKKKK